MSAKFLVLVYLAVVSFEASAVAEQTKSLPGTRHVGSKVCYGTWDKGVKSYSGKLSKTVTGKTCQEWDKQTPQKHPVKYTGESNFCRNPLGDADRPWCYTTTPSTRWEYCDVPKCLDKAIPIPWGEWNSWTSCTVTCGVGKQKRIRSCEGHLHVYEDLECKRKVPEFRDCVTGVPCPIHGAWGTWSICPDYLALASKCLTLNGGCEAGRRRFCRKCDSPRPKFGGDSCFTGSPIKDVDCWNYAACDNSKVIPPQDLKLIGHVNSNDLTVEWTRAAYGLVIHDFLVKYFVEGYSSVKKEQTVLVNEEEVLGKRYSLTLTEFTKGQVAHVSVISRHLMKSGGFISSVPRSLSFRISRIDGQYGPWVHWGRCSKMCGFGVTFRTRVCNNPPPSTDGFPCEGKAKEQKPCRMTLCPSNL